MEKESIDILFVAGGTAGPAVPLIAVADELPKNLHVGWVRGRWTIVSGLVENRGEPVWQIHTGKLARFFSLSTIATPLLVLWGYFESLVLLNRLRPKLIVGAGSYTVVPVCWAAWTLGIPYIIHQQDFIPGLANKLIVGGASKITSAFPDQFGGRAEQIGNPVRSKILQGSPDSARQRFNIPFDSAQGIIKPVVLVLGGGSGAQSLNTWVNDTLAELKKNGFVLHSTGKGKSTPTLPPPDYRGRKNSWYHAQEFFNEVEMADALAVADVVVSRAGMSTIAELSALEKPTILVPLAGHQEYNARALKDAVIVVRSVDAILPQIKKLLASDTRRSDLGKKFAQLFPQGATEKLVEIIKSLLPELPSRIGRAETDVEGRITCDSAQGIKCQPFADVKKVSMIGIGGVGVSALAKYFLWRGIGVTGFDTQENEFVRDLIERGVTIKIGSAPAEDLPAETDLVIFSAAVPAENPLRQEARRRGIKQFSYPQALGEISRSRLTIAITGTKGKTTTTALVGHILATAGLDPLVIVGGKTPAFPEGNFRAGVGPFVVEACEYRAHMLELSPERIVLTNVEPEHLDFYKDQADITNRMVEFAQKLPSEGVLIVSQDDPGSRAVGERFGGAKATFGLQEPASVSADERRVLSDTHQSFRLFTHEQSADKKHTRHIGHGRVEINLPGLYSIQNALAAAAVALSWGVSFENIRVGLASFPATLWRRFERVGEWQHRPVISDYAHHPLAIKSVIQAAREVYPHKKIVVIFQPHLVSRTTSLFTNFVHALATADQVFIMPTYRVSGREGKEAPDTSPQKLVIAITKTGHQKAKFAANTQILIPALKPTGQDSVLLFLGAGDIDAVARKVVS